MDHSLLTSTRFEFVDEAPTTAPAIGEAQTKIQFFANGVFAWIWRETIAAWEGCNWRSASGTNSPTGNITPLFVGMTYFQTSSFKLYYAASPDANGWVTHSDGTGSGGGSGGGGGG